MGFIESIYGRLAVFAGTIATLWGLTKAIGALRAWVRKRRFKWSERRDLPRKTLDILQAMQKEFDERDSKQEGRLLEIGCKVDKVFERQAFTAQQIATMQNEKLCWAYMHYGKRQNPVPLQTKLSLERMYKQYRDAGGQNHVPDDWQAVMDAAPVEGASQ